MIPPSVALVAMPFAGCRVPPIGLGILKGALSAAGLPSRIYHFNLDILPDLGRDGSEALTMADLIVSSRETMIGEWLHAKPDAARDEPYLQHLLDRGIESDVVARVRELRPRLDAWIERWARRVAAGGHDIVGFSCSMDRTRASVRLAEAIRHLAPDTRVIAGGYSATGEMGLAMLEAFEVFDLVCHAEGDELIVPIVDALRGRPGASLEALRGISYRTEGRIITHAAGAAHADLERTPLADYDDYVECVESLRRSWDPTLRLPSALPLETARGCWWGARALCTFCSLNGDRVAYRAKSPERVLLEIGELHQRYGPKPFEVVDNVLGDASFDSLLPALAQQRPKKSFAWEVRPNLGRDQVAALVRAGVVQVQPGIESLSTPALRRMRKGTSAIENLQTLKWLCAYRVRCNWNFLYSLPGEGIEWYEEVVRAIPRVMHLPPPSGPYRIRLQRFSPLFTAASDERVQIAGPTVFARLAFDDLPGDLLDRLAYDFDYEIVGRAPGLDDRIRALLDPRIEAWRSHYETNGCTLTLLNGPGESLLVIGPLFQPERLVRVTGLMRRLLDGCASVCSEERLQAKLSGPEPDEAENGEPALDPGSYRRLVAELRSFGAVPEGCPDVGLADAVRFADERGWVYRESGRILALPVDQTHLARSGALMFDAAVRRRGHRASRGA